MSSLTDMKNQKASDAQPYTLNSEHSDLMYYPFPREKIDPYPILTPSCLQNRPPQIPHHPLHRTLPLRNLHRLPRLPFRHRPPPRLQQILPPELLERPLALHLPLQPFLLRRSLDPERHHQRRRPLLRGRQRPPDHGEKGPRD